MTSDYHQHWLNPVRNSFHELVKKKQQITSQYILYFLNWNILRHVHILKTKSENGNRDTSQHPKIFQPFLINFCGKIVGIDIRQWMYKWKVNKKTKKQIDYFFNLCELTF